MTDTPAPVVRAEELRKSYKRRGKDPIRALDGASLSITEGDWVALLGPNGSGKSTLMRAVTGAIRPDAGRLEVFGRSIQRQDQSLRERLGVVFQAPGLDRLLTVRENLRTQAALFGWVGDEADARVALALERVGLFERAADRVGTLSGGLTRRVDLARALLSEPDLLLLDEPSSGLDPASRRAFLDLLESTRIERPSMTIVMSTHLMDEADRCDSIVLMQRGRVLAHESPDRLRAGLGELALHADPEHADAMRELGLDVRADGERAVGAGSVPQLAHAAGTLAIRAVPFTLAPPTLEDVYLAHTPDREARP